MQTSIGVTDGERLWAFRYSTEGKSRSLFVSNDAHAMRQAAPRQPAHAAAAGRGPRRGVRAALRPPGSVAGDPRVDRHGRPAGAGRAAPFHPRMPAQPRCRDAIAGAAGRASRQDHDTRSSSRSPPSSRRWGSSSRSSSPTWSATRCSRSRCRSVFILGLDPPVSALERRGWGRGKAALLVFASIALVLSVIVIWAAKPLWREITGFVDDLPGYVDKAQHSGVLRGRRQGDGRVQEARERGRRGGEEPALGGGQPARRGRRHRRQRLLARDADVPHAVRAARQAAADASGRRAHAAAARRAVRADPRSRSATPSRSP